MDLTKSGQMDIKTRIDYIDTLRGLCMLSIVWYHTDHPDFLNYPYPDRGSRCRGTSVRATALLYRIIPFSYSPRLSS